nr:pilin [Halomonas sp. 3H]
MARSQFAEAHSLLGGSRVAVQESIDAGRQIDAALANLGLQLQGKHGGILTADVDAYDPGTATTDFEIQYQFGHVAITGETVEYSPRLNSSGTTGAIVTYTYDADNGLWSCETDADTSVATNCDEATTP